MTKKALQQQDLMNVQRPRDPDVRAAVREAEVKSASAEKRSQVEKRVQREEAQEQRENYKKRYDRNRTRACFDLPPEQIGRIRALAKEHGVSCSDLARWLLDFALLSLDKGTLVPRVRPSTANIRFRYEMVLESEGNGRTGQGWEGVDNPRRYLREPNAVKV